MDEMLTEQLEWLLSSNLQGTRLDRCLLVLTGCLAGDDLPDNIKQQMADLSRQATLQGYSKPLLLPSISSAKLLSPFQRSKHQPRMFVQGEKYAR